MTPIRRRNLLDRQVPVVAERPCARCGQPVPVGQVWCKPPCQPRIVAPKEKP